MTPRGHLLTNLALVAPGTPLREGFERILRGRTGALVVLGRNSVIESISTGGFPLDVAYTPTALRELAKMDGAIVLELDHSRPDPGIRIVGAGVHLTPDPAIDTIETGTRHRTADRVAREADLPVVTVSASMAMITLFLDGGRHHVEGSEQLLSRANQTLEALERYRERLRRATGRLSALEVQDQATVRDVAQVAQRLELVRRLEAELNAYVVGLGTDGRLLTLQLHEMGQGVADLRVLLEKDYRPESGESFSLLGLEPLTTAQLLDQHNVARAVGFSADQHLDTVVSSRGYRQISTINRLPASLGARLIEHFGTLQSLFAASRTELQAVDGVGETRARIIRDGLIRLTESAYAESVD